MNDPDVELDGYGRVIAVYDSAAGEWIHRSEHMSIETKAAKTGLKLTAKLAEIYRRWRTRLARRRTGMIYKASALLIVCLTASSCQNLDRAYISLDDARYGSSTALTPVPAGYVVVWDVYDGANNRLDISGYYRLPRLEAKADTLPAKLDAEKLPDPNEPPSVKDEVLSAIRESQTSASGAQAAMDIIEAAK